MKKIFAASIIFFLSAHNVFPGPDDIQLTAGGTAQIFQNRFVKEKDQSKSDIFLTGTYKGFAGFAEKRNERTLGSALYKNEFFYLSAGHRYKPVPGFYLLRDPDFYSAFSNPKSGIVPQPLVESAWLGIFPDKWSGGIFFGKNLAEKRAGIYLKSPLDIAAVTYSPETKSGYFSLNLRNFQLSKGKGEPEFTLNSEVMGTKRNYIGQFNSKSILPKQGIEAELSVYREENGKLFATSLDNFSSENSSVVKFLKLSRYHYDRLEIFESKSNSMTERILGLNASLLSGNYGGACIRGRVYENKLLSGSENSGTPAVGAGGISYEYRLKSTEFYLGGELRQNKDRIGELKFTIKPDPEWKFEISSIVQAERNKLRSLFEQWSDGENINTILTDRTSIFKIKAITPFIIFNISGSRKKDGRGEIYFANIQFKFDF